MLLPVEQQNDMEIANEQRPIGARQAVADGKRISALVIAADERDRLFVTAALEASGWKLRFVRDAFEAGAALAAESIPVVIMDGDAQVPSWRDLLARLSGTEPARIIIFFRQADERLWAEVFNLGAYDLLPKPLNLDELTWVARSALSERNACADSAASAVVVEGSTWNGY